MLPCETQVENVPFYEASGQVAANQESGSRTAVLLTTGASPEPLSRRCSVCNQAGWGPAITGLRWKEWEDCLLLPARPPVEGLSRLCATVGCPTCD